MVNQQEAVKQPRKQVLGITAPTRCVSCGTKERKIKDYGGWLILNIGAEGVFLFVCPKCQNVQTNKEALRNTKLINQYNERRVITN